MPFVIWGQVGKIKLDYHFEADLPSFLHISIPPSMDDFC